MAISASDIPHYIWAKSTADSNDHYVVCRAQNLPTISISKHGRGLVYVSYDSLSMFGGDSNKSRRQSGIMHQVIKFYRVYFNCFSLPEDSFHASGGETAFGFVVKKEHADFIAEGLYHFLLARKYNEPKKLGKMEAEKDGNKLFPEESKTTCPQNQWFLKPHSESEQV